MGIRQLRPTTPSARFMILSYFAEITRSTPRSTGSFRSQSLLDASTSRLSVRTF